MADLFLTDAELQDATRYRQPASQARFLERMRVPYRRRRDGTLLVGRAALERAMMEAEDQPKSRPMSNGLKREPVDTTGLNWSTPA